MRATRSDAMHLNAIRLHPERYPETDRYPFNQPLLRETTRLAFTTPVTLFCGENGAGKSTLLRALAECCEIHIWRNSQRLRYEVNPYEDALWRYIDLEWAEGPVPGSFFGSDTFNDFAQLLDEWAAADPGQLDYFGGKSLMTQSHGQSLMAFFRSRYAIEGLYLLDEPETALSPSSQLELLALLKEMGAAGHAQFIVATHSPILLACPDAVIYSFDCSPVAPIAYEDTEHYRVYKAFMANPEQYR